jgi:nitroreductase
MTNPTLELIHSHASVRHFKPDPLPDEMVETIVAAAQCASSSSNLQAYSVIVVTDADRRRRLAELCGEQAFIAAAPVFLAWVADLARTETVCQMRGTKQASGYVENFLVAALDCAIAAQNAALAAESLGLGMCYVGAIRNNPGEIIGLLELPRLTFPIAGMSLGWPAKHGRVKPRLPLQAILHRDTYQLDQESALQAYDRTMAVTGIYEGRQVPAPGKPEAMAEYGWLEHTARRVSKAVRTGLRAVLEEQGFSLK